MLNNRLADFVRLCTLALLIVGAAGWSEPTYAASFSHAGWWTVAPASIAPDVPADGLLVQGGTTAGQPTAYAGLAFALLRTETPKSLRLTVAPNSATTPNVTLNACPITGSVTWASGAPAANGPKYDCSIKASAGPSSDGTTYTFDVSSFHQNSEFTVAIVPTAATDRVVFAAPTADALETTVVAAPPVTSGSPSTAASPSVGGVTSGAPTPTIAVSRPVTPASTAPTPTTSAAVASKAVQPAATTTNTTATGSDGDSSSFPAFAMVGLAITAAALWAVAGNGGALDLDRTAVDS